MATWNWNGRISYSGRRWTNQNAMRLLGSSANYEIGTHEHLNSGNESVVILTKFTSLEVPVVILPTFTSMAVLGVVILISSIIVRQKFSAIGNNEVCFSGLPEVLILDKVRCNQWRKFRAKLHWAPPIPRGDASIQSANTNYKVTSIDNNG